MLILFGVLVGRLICGFMCPFGFFQDLLYKIPSKKISTKKLKFLRYLKYVFLILFVWLFGVMITDKTGMSSPYFCKYVCPQGILEAAIPLSIANTSIRATLGKLFTWKFIVLLAFTLSSIFIYRPFCKWFCPLGAFYSIFNKISFYKYTVDESLCVHCGKCKRECNMDVDMSKNQDDLECIRCGKCIDICPTCAISTSLSKCDSYKTKC